MFDPVKDIADFHEKFGLTYEDRPRQLPPDLWQFRCKFMQEELEEYLLAMDFKQNQADLAQQLDALVDLVYVALGTAYLHGFDFKEAWRRVHEANMKKVRAADASQSKRNSTHDVVKPPDWTPPVLDDLVA